MALCTVFIAVTEIHTSNQNLRCAALLTVLIRPIPDLQPPGQVDHATLGEMLLDDLRRAAPGHTLDKVNLFFTGLLVGKVPLTGHGKTGHGLAGTGSPQLRVTGDSSRDANYILRSALPPFW